MPEVITSVVLILLLLFVVVVLVRSIMIVPQATAVIVERLGRYSRTLTPGLSILVPFVDRVRATIDLREQVVPGLESAPRALIGLLQGHHLGKLVVQVA